MNLTFPQEIALMLVLVTITSILTSQLIAVPTESMSPAINPGDMVLVEKTNLLDVYYNELNVSDVKEGDIVVYSKPYKIQHGNEQVIENETIIHRVIAVKSYQGQKYLITKGDNNPSYETERIYPAQITGRAIIWNENPVKISGVGHAIIFLKTNLEDIKTNLEGLWTMLNGGAE